MTVFAELRIVFQMFDKDGDGRISMDEVRHVVRSMGQTPNDERIDALFKQVDLDGDGLINYDEFVRLVEERVRAQPDDAEMRAMFEAFDKDKNGYIDKQELITTFAEIELPVSEQEVAQMMRSADIQDGRIFFEGSGNTTMYHLCNRICVLIRMHVTYCGRANYTQCVHSCCSVISPYDVWDYMYGYVMFRLCEDDERAHWC